MSELLNILASETGLSEHDVLSVATTAPSRYKIYKIPKRQGGWRTVSQPAREVKFLQRVIIAHVLSKLPVHRAATAYRDGISIRQNAIVHASSGAIAKFDFKDFFPSITATDWRTYCQIHGVFNDEHDVQLSTNILFSRSKYGSVLRLAIGAPSSPMLSNILMYEFDQKISDTVSRDKVSYTRYADDMTFSAKRAHNLIDVERYIKKTIRGIRCPKIRLNDQKTTHVTRKFRRVVTGLVLADDGTVSLGRDRKRKISATLHRFSKDLLTGEEVSKLTGLLAFANSVEPDFLVRLAKKYGPEIIDQVKSSAHAAQRSIEDDDLPF